MPLPDASLSAPLVTAARLIFADFADLPLRVAQAPFSLAVPGGLTDADADCAGFTFDATNDAVLDISVIRHDETGTETVVLTLRAAPSDTALRTAIETPSLYVGRVVRLWNVLHDGAGTVTAISPNLGYTGFMSEPTQTVDPASGVMEVTMRVENWAAIFGRAPARTYLMQKQIDATDASADVSIGNAAAVPGLINIGGAAIDLSKFVQQR